jgi:hypothetical protein
VSGNRQMSVILKRLVDFLSMVTHKRSVTIAITTRVRNYISVVSGIWPLLGRSNCGSGVVK